VGQLVFCARGYMKKIDQVMIDTGDTVRHISTGETWLVACVQGNDLSWCGWPEGYAKVNDCELIRKAPPEERLAMLAETGGQQFQLDAKQLLTIIAACVPVPNKHAIESIQTIEQRANQHNESHKPKRHSTEEIVAYLRVKEAREIVNAVNMLKGGEK